MIFIYLINMKRLVNGVLFFIFECTKLDRYLIVKMRKKNKNDHQKNENSNSIENELTKIEESIQKQTSSIQDFIQFHKDNHITSPQNSTILTLIDLLEKEIALNKMSRTKLLQVFNKYLQTNFSDFKEIIQYCQNMANQIQTLEEEQQIYITKIAKQKNKIKSMKRGIDDNTKSFANSSFQQIESNNKLIDDLKNELSAAKIECAQLKAQNDILKNSNQKGEESQTKKAEKLKKLKNENDSLHQELMECKRKLEEQNLMLSVKEQHSKVDQNNQLISLESENTKLKADVSNLKDEIKLRDDKLNKKSKKLDELKCQITKLNNDFFSMKLEVTSSNNDKNQIKQLTAANEELGKKLSQFQNENSNLIIENRKMQSVSSEMNELKEKLGKKKRKMEEMESKNQKQLDQMNQKNDELREKLQTLQNEKNQLSIEIDRLKEEIQKVCRESNQILSDKGSEVDSYLETIKKKQAKVDSLKAEIKKLKDDYSSESEKDKNTIHKLQLSNQTYTNENASLQNSVKVNSELIERMKQEIAQLKAELLSLNDKIQKEQAMKHEKDERKEKESQSKYDKMKERAEKESNANKKLKMVIKNLNEKIEKITNENEKMMNNQSDCQLKADLLTNSESDNQRLQNKIKALHAENEKLRETIAELRNQTDKSIGMQSEIRIRDAEILKLTSEKKQLEADIEKAKMITAETTDNFRELTAKMHSQLYNAQEYKNQFGRQEENIEQLKVMLDTTIEENKALKRELVYIKEKKIPDAQLKIQEVQNHYIKKASKIESQAFSEVDYLNETIRKLKKENERYFCENQKLIENNKKLTTILAQTKMKLSYQKNHYSLNCPNTKKLKKEVVETKKIAQLSDTDCSIPTFCLNSSSSSSSSYSSAIIDDSLIMHRIGALESQIDSLQSDVTLFS